MKRGHGREWTCADKRQSLVSVEAAGGRSGEFSARSPVLLKMMLLIRRRSRRRHMHKQWARGVELIMILKSWLLWMLLLLLLLHELLLGGW